MGRTKKVKQDEIEDIEIDPKRVSPSRKKFLDKLESIRERKRKRNGEA